MNARVFPALALLAVLAVAVTPGADAAKPERHSGTVAAIDVERGLLVIDEVGPWSEDKGAAVSTRRNVVLTSETRFNLFMRVDVPGTFARDFVEVDLAPVDVSPGDFVTAECVREGRRLKALVVTVAELP